MKAVIRQPENNVEMGQSRKFDTIRSRPLPFARRTGKEQVSNKMEKYSAGWGHEGGMTAGAACDPGPALDMKRRARKKVSRGA